VPRLKTGEAIPLLPHTSSWREQEKRLDLRRSGMLSSVDWYLFPDVSKKPIISIFKGHAIQEE
jgi:hypothetical protein